MNLGSGQSSSGRERKRYTWAFYPLHTSPAVHGRIPLFWEMDRYGFDEVGDGVG